MKNFWFPLIVALALWASACTAQDNVTESVDEVFIQHVQSKLFLDKDGKLVKPKGVAARFTFSQFGAAKDYNYAVLVYLSGQPLEVKGSCEKGSQVGIGKIETDDKKQLFHIDEKNVWQSSCNPKLYIAPNEDKTGLILKEKGDSMDEFQYVTVM
ncbi:uncharacterized protein LOC132705064 [Cylas formicarius]|uniref:uncharacterized protein LOC132705064 n=1 Tax=Cylas formicarius TaxID=197179 RepID=UPI0029589285|nr:uncharacterized protein LOC132705064 [Cylas formicarius]